MIPARIAVRKTIRGLIEDGFNDALASAIANYNQAYNTAEVPFTIDFSDPSSIVESQITPKTSGLSRLIKAPAGMAIYTVAAIEREGNQRMKPTKFHGDVTSHVDVYFLFKDDIEPQDTETLLDAVEDAVRTLLSPPSAWPGNMIPHSIHTVRPPLIQTPKGYVQYLPHEITTEIVIR